MTIVLTVLGLSLLVILHEAGHYLVARACRMRVLRFSVGFGPALLKFTHGDTQWQLAAIPLGGFVQIDGMGADQDSERAPDEHTFRSRPLWQRILVIFAGPAMNWALAAALIAGLAATVGLESYDDASMVIGEVASGLPAEAAGLRPNDRIVRVDGEPVTSWRALVRRLQQSAGTPLQVEIERPYVDPPTDTPIDTPIDTPTNPPTNAAANPGAPATLSLVVTPVEENGVGRIGVGQQPHTVELAPGPALAAGVEWAATMTARQASLLWGMLVGREEGQLSGLPGIVSELSSQAKRGLHRLLQSLAWLSITLFLLNLAPVPALDGGRLVFLGVETVRGKPIDERIEGIVHAVGFMLLVGLMIFVSVRDLVG